jgi:sulfur relay (sulfurtransferase) DsrF/TusC family protein
MSFPYRCICNNIPAAPTYRVYDTIFQSLWPGKWTVMYIRVRDIELAIQKTKGWAIRTSLKTGEELIWVNRSYRSLSWFDISNTYIHDRSLSWFDISITYIHDRSLSWFDISNTYIHDGSLSWFHVYTW